jgi:hypothetical protein
MILKDAIIILTSASEMSVDQTRDSFEGNQVWSSDDLRQKDFAQFIGGASLEAVGTLAELSDDIDGD